MQIILSCAKDMTAESDRRPQLLTSPLFERDAKKGVMQLANYTTEDIARLLKCNAKIAAQNKLRYLAFLEGGPTLQAALSYTGVAYRHLKAGEMTDDDYAFANRHLWITSFLYGLLRPMDGIHNYRLEGNVRLPDNNGQSMFDYWKPRLTDVLIDAIKADDGILIHDATEEMTRLFDWKRIKKEVKVVEPQFLVRTDKGVKVVTVYAKMCRGAFARYIITNRIKEQSALEQFEYEGFTLDEAYTDRDRGILGFVLG